MKLDNKTARSEGNIDFVAFSGMLIYFTILVLFSYQEGMTLYAKLSASVLVLYFVGKAALNARVRLEVPAEYKLLIIWLFWALLSMFFSENLNLALNKILTLVQVLAISYVVFCMVVWQKRTGGHWLIIVVAALVASIAIFIDPEKYIGHDGRMHGPVGNANLLALLLITATVICVVFTFVYKNFLMKILARYQRVNK